MDVYYTLDYTEYQCRAAFVARFGVEPERVERVMYPTPFKVKGTIISEWGYWMVGPVPGSEKYHDK